MAIKMQLKKLEKEELCSLLEELISLSKENSEFLEMKLKNNEMNFYKKRIKSLLWNEKLKLREAVRVLSAFRKTSKNPEHILELMLFYVENGVEIGEEYGDMYDAFYSNIESVFEQIIKMLNEHKEFISKFKERLDSVIDRSCSGWNHQDTLIEIFGELDEGCEDL